MSATQQLGRQAARTPALEALMERARAMRAESTVDGSQASSWEA